MADFQYDIYHGDTFQLPISVADSAGAAVNLSTYTYEFGMQADAGTITGSTSGVTIGTTNKATGSITITVPYTIMAGSFSPFKQYLFDFSIISSGTVKETLFVGKLGVMEDVL